MDNISLNNKKMKYYLFILIASFSLLLISCNEVKTDKKDLQGHKVEKINMTDTPIFIVIGKPYKPMESQRLANKYGFEIQFMGCIRNEENDSLEKITNTKTNKYLQRRFGDDFWTKFYNELDTIREE